MTIIICLTLLLGLVTGYTYLLYQHAKKSDDCITEVLKDDTKLNDYYGHKIDKEDIWVHAQAAVSEQYLRCISRRDL